MPQMFPLLWLYLFLSCAIALFTMKTLLFFTIKTNPSNFFFSVKNKEHNWKW